jgi:hypothetical protein
MSNTPQNVSVEFDLSAAGVPRGEFVVRSGKLFQAGEYPDKQFNVTADELRRIVATFTPVQVNTSHLTDPVLDGALGQLEHVWLSEDGTELWGRVTLPVAFETLTKQTQHRVSLEFDRASKRISGIAIVKNPRIDDAAIFERTAPMAENAKKPNLFQRFLDKVRTLPGGEAVAAEFDGEAAPGDTPAPAPAFSAASAPAPVEDPKVAALEAQNAQFAAQLKALRDKDIASQAAQFADAAIREGKAMPAEKAALVAQFTQAIRDDESSPVKVTFGEGKEGSRVDALKAGIEARPAHGLFTERLEQGDVEVLFGKAMPADRTDALLEKTPLGRAAKKAKMMKKEAC